MLQGKIKAHQQVSDVLFLLKELHVEYNRISLVSMERISYE